MTPAALDLLRLIAKRDIPMGLCDFRPKVELLRGGYVVSINELTNTLSERGGNTFVRRVLHITEVGREYLYTDTIRQLIQATTEWSE